jgi:hypothetical protein
MTKLSASSYVKRMLKKLGIKKTTKVSTPVVLDVEVAIDIALALTTLPFDITTRVICRGRECCRCSTYQRSTCRVTY